MIQPEKTSKYAVVVSLLTPLFYRLQRKSIGDIEPFK